MLDSPITVTGGTGAFAANTTVYDVLSGNTLTTSSAPTTALSNANIQILGTQNISVRSFPGIYITTTSPNQIVQYSLSGVIEVDCFATALLASKIATAQIDFFVDAYVYVPGSTVLTNPATTIYQQSFNPPSLYFTNFFYIFTQAFSMSGLVQEFPSAGTYVISVSAGVQTINGTITYSRMAIDGLAGAATVLKNQ
jgi:hypothetical protein